MLLKKITSEHLVPFKHGFYTRGGGNSKGIYSSLNCGLNSFDKPELISKNRRLIAKDIKIREENLLSVSQIHSTTIINANAIAYPLPKADGLVSRKAGLGLTITSADCQPVLFADANAGIIGATHAGWRGTINGILERTVCAMEEIGANRNNIIAVIGPCISQNAYEVGIDFFNEFVEKDSLAEKFFKKGCSTKKLQFNLPGYSIDRLLRHSVKTAVWTGQCTYRDEESFFSYRRSCHRKEVDYGRLISIIAL